MSMTREEAIKSLKNIVEYWTYKPTEVEAAKMAIAALRPVSRERVEKVWRGEWKPTESPYMNECEDCSARGYRTPWGHGFRFCPSCGAAQTDEALEIVMERLEELHETT